MSIDRGARIGVMLLVCSAGHYYFGATGVLIGSIVAAITLNL